MGKGLEQAFFKRVYDSSSLTNTQLHSFFLWLETTDSDSPSPESCVKVSSHRVPTNPTAFLLISQARLRKEDGLHGVLWPAVSPSCLSNPCCFPGWAQQAGEAEAVRCTAQVITPIRDVGVYTQTPEVFPWSYIEKRLDFRFCQVSSANSVRTVPVCPLGLLRFPEKSLCTAAWTGTPSQHPGSVA